jgi:hypothetical protein
MTLPASPSWIICGLIIQQVQLLNEAVVPKLEEKYNCFSLSKSKPELEAWMAFLNVSVPNWALKDLGKLLFASDESVGPIID